MPAVAPAHQPPPPAALTTNQMWQHAVCGTRAWPVPPANLSTAETSLQRDTRQRDTGSDSENLDPWRPDRVACSPPFPEQRAAYGRARCAETDAVDVSVVVEPLASEAVVELAARARGVEEEIRLLSGSEEEIGGAARASIGGALVAAVAITTA